MEFKNVLSLGLKVLVGAAIGFVAVAGMEKLSISRKTINTPDLDGEGRPMPSVTGVGRSEVAVSDGILDTVHTAQELCSRANLLVNSAAVVAENLHKVFSPDPYSCQYQDNYYRGDSRNLGNNWRRQGSFIIEAPGNPNGYYNYDKYRGM